VTFTGNRVRFRLLPAGRDAVAAVLSQDTEDLEGFVVDEDDLGVWIAIPKPQRKRDVMLLKWEHFLTAVTQWDPEPFMERPAAGFRPS